MAELTSKPSPDVFGTKAGLILVSWSLPKAPPALAPYAHNAAPKSSGETVADTPCLMIKSNDGSAKTAELDSQTKTTSRRQNQWLKQLKPLKRSH